MLVEDLLTIPEAAAALGYNKKMIYRLIKRGVIVPVRDPFKLIDALRIPRSQIDAMKRTRDEANPT